MIYIQDKYSSTHLTYHRKKQWSKKEKETKWNSLWAWAEHHQQREDKQHHSTTIRHLRLYLLLPSSAENVLPKKKRKRTILTKVVQRPSGFIHSSTISTLKYFPPKPGWWTILLLFISFTVLFPCQLCWSCRTWHQQLYLSQWINQGKICIFGSYDM